jgi:DNA-binding CsgD family transcriptional regulator/PAS domain-containing protein
VLLANEAASALFGRSLASLPGTRAGDLLTPDDAVTTTVAVLGSGLFDVVGGERVLRTTDGETAAVRMWTRVIELEPGRVGVSLYVPVDQVGRLGRDPFVRWRDLAPVAVGTTDRTWHISLISADVRQLLGTDPGALVGQSLVDLAHPHDRWRLTDYPESLTAPHFEHGIRFRHADGSWVDACILLAARTTPAEDQVAFALVGIPTEPSRRTTPERLAELELRLRHIGAEVRAAGVLEDIDAMPRPTRHPKLRELTSRQWEILSRLSRGERVSTIAAALFISQSTVRNHLGNIYEKFGVHSQAELLAELQRSGHDEPASRP